MADTLQAPQGSSFAYLNTRLWEPADEIRRVSPPAQLLRFNLALVEAL
ncbi:MAG TPA: hypothetical protein VHM01_14335 [Alphaproteobacteria bacterium]|nr:hypothetical protein [Alphaproteobacteria bacterium]